MKRNQQMFTTSLMVIAILFYGASPALSWNITENGRDEIGDRRFTAYVGKVERETILLTLGCVEGDFSIKIATDVDFDEEERLRVRFDSKKSEVWGFFEGPSTDVVRTMDLDKPINVLQRLLKSKKFVIQFYTYSGANIIKSFNVTNTSKLLNGIRKAGCRV